MAANVTWTQPFPRSLLTKASGIAVTGGPLPLFTVAGGRVMVRSLYGIVIVIIGGTNTTIKLSANVAGTDSDLCAASASIATKAVGTFFAVQGPVATALLISTGEGAVQNASAPLIVAPGTIDLVMVTGGTTGTADWYCEWSPVDIGATLS